MESKMHRSFFAAAAAILVSSATPYAYAAATDYRFELAGSPQGNGASTVSVKLVHVPDNKPVTGAAIVKSRADMGPIGMAAMSAPVKALGEQPPGTYRFEISNGSVWKQPANWALSLSAKVPGEAQPVTGSVTVKLTP